MSGYGYGEAKRARRDRSGSRSVPRTTAPEKRPKDKKEKKAKKQQRTELEDPRRDRKRDKALRSRSPRRDQPREGTPREAGSEQGDLVRTVSKTPGSGPDSGARKGAWREELTKDSQEVKGGEGEDDGGKDSPASGIIAQETEEDVELALKKSRERREALIAKWVNRGEGVPNVPETPMVEAESDTEDGEDEGDRHEVTPPQESKPEDEEALKEKRAINQFIIRHKAEHDGDMFGDDDKGENDKALKTGVRQSAAISQTGASADDWDDSEGYYRAKIGEVIAGRYLVVEDTCGKGVFSNVVKAKDQNNGELVAIKVMRCNDMMRKAAEKEVEVLERCNRADKGNKRHVIKLFRHFMYRGHLCLVFECMWDNLRVALKKYTKDKGMSLQAVRAYTKQLLIGLRHVHRCRVIHADIKPDNILISAGHNLVKICDLGSAIEDTEVEPTPYLVSRFYRSPEIILGMKYGPAADVFALGGTLFELFTGKILFPGKTNNDMLRHFMDLRGKLPHKMIKSGMLWKQHFDENLDFQHQDTDKATRKKKTRTITDCSAKKSMQEHITQRVGPEKAKSTEPDDVLYIKKTKQFADLLNQMCTLDPDKRPLPNELLNHPFIAEAGPGSKTKDGKGPSHKK